MCQSYFWEQNIWPYIQFWIILSWQFLEWRNWFASLRFAGQFTNQNSRKTRWIHWYKNLCYIFVRRRLHSVQCTLNGCEGYEPYPWLCNEAVMRWERGGVYWQRKDVILLLTTNVSLPASLDHNTKTSPHGNDGHSIGEEILTAFCPWQQLQKYMISY